jgi:hypothetical protein
VCSTAAIEPGRMKRVIFMVVSFRLDARAGRILVGTMQSNP